MKLLIIDHNFQQDIEALREVLNGHQLRVVTASSLSIIAGKYLPGWAFYSFRTEDFIRPDYIKQYRRYEEFARRMLHNIYMTFPFDAVISPSDLIVYIRPWVTFAHELGVPFIVLQKETTVMPLFMTENARTIGQSFPFISDLMLVCSERLKQFWLNAGAQEDKIVVTGQPRFDFYRRTKRTRSLAEIGVQVPKGRPTILFLSYDVDITYAIGNNATFTWMQLREETESTLMALAHRGCINVLIKPHPQQQGLRNYRHKLQTMAKDLWGNAVQYIPENSDVRPLIVNADAVVGFQTTALIEAMAARKKVVYAFWTGPAKLYAADLIPFHQMNDAICIVHSTQELENILMMEQDDDKTKEKEKQRLRIVEEHLGPLDGYAAERCIRQIEACIENFAAQTEGSIRELRTRLNKLAPAYCKRMLWRKPFEVVFLQIVEWLWPLAYPLWLIVRLLKRKRRGPVGKYGEYRRELVRRRHAALETILWCRATLAKRDHKGEKVQIF